MNWKVTESDFKYIEDEVRLYPLYKKTLLAAINNLILSTPERDDNGGGKSNLPSRPVENIVFNLYADARIRKLKEYVDAIEQAVHELDDEKKRFIDAVYWSKQHKTITGICEEFSISQATFLRWKKGFLYRVGLITGDKRNL